MTTADHSVEPILVNTYTTSDAYKRLLVLEDILQHALFKRDADAAGIPALLKDRQERGNDGGACEKIAAWDPSFFARFSGESLNRDIETLKSAVEGLPKLVLYAPVFFDAKEIEMIGVWCRKNIDQRLLLDVRIDPQAGGGCMFVWHDTLHDFSLRYFLKKRSGEFAKIMADHAARAKNDALAPAH